MKLLKAYSKEEKSWMFYDWAHSAHSVLVVTVLPIFYNTIVGLTSDPTGGMSSWGYATSGAMMIIAFLAPFLGALGDFERSRKKWFVGFVILGALACAALSVTPLLSLDSTAAAEKVGLAILILYIISQIGYSGANIYYDSFLNDVTTHDRMDKVSVMGYGLGYIGGSTIPLLIFLLLNLAGVPMIYSLSIAFGLTAVWWLVFSFPMFKNVKQKHYIKRERGAFRDVLAGLGKTVRDIVGYRELLVFLLAYFFYIDGVNTIIHMSTIYGDTLGIDSTQMLLALLLVQLLGLPFALLYIKLADKFGARKMVGFAICMYMFICIFAFFVRETWHFWALAVLVATSQGGIQALSRSIYGKLIPDPNRTGEFFGFYEIFGKFSAIMGPAIVAFTSAFAADRIALRWGIGENPDLDTLTALNAAAAPWGVLSIIIIFIIGGILFFGVLPRVKDKTKENKV